MASAKEVLPFPGGPDRSTRCSRFKATGAKHVGPNVFLDQLQALGFSREREDQVV